MNVFSQCYLYLSYNYSRTEGQDECSVPCIGSTGLWYLAHSVCLNPDSTPTADGVRSMRLQAHRHLRRGLYRTGPVPRACELSNQPLVSSSVTWASDPPVALLIRPFGQSCGIGYLYLCLSSLVASSPQRNHGSRWMSDVVKTRNRTAAMCGEICILIVYFPL